MWETDVIAVVGIIPIVVTVALISFVYLILYCRVNRIISRNLSRIKKLLRLASFLCWIVFWGGVIFIIAFYSTKHKKHDAKAWETVKNVALGALPVLWITMVVESLISTERHYIMNVVSCDVMRERLMPMWNTQPRIRWVCNKHHKVGSPDFKVCSKLWVRITTCKSKSSCRRQSPGFQIIKLV